MLHCSELRGDQLFTQAPTFRFYDPEAIKSQGWRHFYSHFCKFCPSTYFVLLRHFWSRADTCPTSTVGFLTLYVSICTRGMWYGGVLETFSQREHQRTQLYQLPHLIWKQNFSRQLLWFVCCGCDPCVGWKQPCSTQTCRHFYLLPEKGQVQFTQSFSKG